MLKQLILSAIVLTSTAHAVELLQCRTDLFNPNFEFKIDKDAAQNMKGTLSRTINGYAGVTRTPLGTENLKIILNPASCEAEIVSQTSPSAQFNLILPLGDIGVRTGYAAGNKDFAGVMTGKKAICSKHDSDLIRSLIAVCEKFPSMDRDIEFKKTTDVIKFLAGSAPQVSDRQSGDDKSSVDLGYQSFDPFARKGSNPQ